MPGIPVPIYQQKIKPQTGTQYQQNLRADPDAYGASIGQGVSSLTQNIAGIVVKERVEDAENALISAHTKATQARIELETEFQDLKGSDVTGDAVRLVREKYTKAIEDLTKTLPDIVKNRWDNQLKPQQLSALSAAMDRHAVTQREVVRNDTLNTALSVAKLDATKYSAVTDKSEDLPYIDAPIKVGLAALETRARQQGKPQDVIDNLKHEFTNEAKAEVVVSMLANKKNELAREYFKNSKPDMSQETIDKLEAKFRVSDVDGWALGQAAEVQKQFVSKDGFNFDYTKARAYVLEQAGNDPDKAKAGLSWVENIYQSTKQATTAHDEPFVNKALDIIYLRGDLADVRELHADASDDGKAKISQAMFLAQERFRDMRSKIDKRLEDEFWALPADERKEIATGNKKFDSEHMFSRDGAPHFNRIKRDIAEDGGVSSTAFESVLKNSVPFKGEQKRGSTEDVANEIFLNKAREAYRSAVDASPDKKLKPDDKKIAEIIAESMGGSHPKPTIKSRLGFGEPETELDILEQARQIRASRGHAKPSVKPQAGPRPPTAVPPESQRIYSKPLRVKDKQTGAIGIWTPPGGSASLPPKYEVVK